MIKKTKGNINRLIEARLRTMLLSHKDYFVKAYLTEKYVDLPDSVFYSDCEKFSIRELLVNPQEKGYYWVKTSYFGDYSPAHYDGHGSWYILWADEPIKTVDLFAIGEKVVEPSGGVK